MNILSNGIVSLLRRFNLTEIKDSGGDTCDEVICVHQQFEVRLPRELQAMVQDLISMGSRASSPSSHLVSFK